MRASPQVGCSSVARTLIVVVLPAPLGPMKPKQSPSLISRLRFDSATSVPYRLVRLTVLIITAIRRPSCELPPGGSWSPCPSRCRSPPPRVRRDLLLYHRLG